MMKNSFYRLCLVLLLSSGYVFGQTSQNGMPVESFGIYELSNGQEIRVLLSNFGARILAIWVPDQNGIPVNVIKGSEKPQDYRQGPTAGASIGRYANRIAKGRFELDGQTYRLDINNGPNSLHGGFSGFSTKQWTVKEQDARHIRFSYRSPDGEGGFPGNLQVDVTYTLTSSKGLEIAYEASTDKNTVINFTNHAYFNLNGKAGGDISTTRVRIDADQITPVDTTLIPTGEQQEVSGTPFDFRQEKAIGRQAFDHNFVLKKKKGLKFAAEAFSPISGIQMTVYTEEPGMQFYTSDFSAFCFETQHFPDSPNQPGFPSTLLKKGQTFRSRTVYQFGLKE